MNWSGFHKLPLAKRLERVATHAGLSPEDLAAITAASGLPLERSEAFIENAAGSYPLPLGFAVGFQIDGEDVVVPMAVEESSVIAAACNGAKMAGNLETGATEPVTIGQVEIRDPANPEAFWSHRASWIEQLNKEVPSMVKRGGGVRDLTIRLMHGRAVLHIHLDTRDAMGANAVNTLCEFLAPNAAEALGGRIGLRILSNLSTERMAWATARIPVANLGEDVAKAMVEANEFAILDPYRAATHNKGILNGIDPVVIATGNDWRAVEAGAHAYAGLDGYRSLTHYELDGTTLVARLALPLSVGTVGGVTKLHPVAAACLSVLGNPSAQRLARIMCAVGLAQNISALRALSSEGIQAGHMALHAKNASLRKANDSTTD
ncbi:MAG: hydroxymethylglutaryl-CoA reductase, degradative [Thermoplasmatota archaeon]